MFKAYFISDFETISNSPCIQVIKVLLKFLRLELQNAISVTTAAAVLHNIALDWQDDVPADDHPGLLFFCPVKS